jgi:hypothetical protein
LRGEDDARSIRLREVKIMSTAPEPKYSVCPECEGEGFVGTLGAFTPGELHDYYDTPDDYRDAHRASLVPCDCCKGQRVVTAQDLAEYEERAEYEAERRAESRYCGMYDA